MTGVALPPELSVHICSLVSWWGACVVAGPMPDFRWLCSEAGWGGVSSSLHTHWLCDLRQVTLLGPQPTHPYRGVRVPTPRR